MNILEKELVETTRILQEQLALENRRRVQLERENVMGRAAIEIVRHILRIDLEMVDYADVGREVIQRAKAFAAKYPED